MFLIYLAVLAAPAPVFAPGPKYDLSEDIPVLCRLRFDDLLNQSSAGNPHPDSPIIDMYAERAGISDADKLLIESFCSIYELGAQHVLDMMDQESADEASSTEEPYVTSFVI